MHNAARLLLLAIVWAPTFAYTEPRPAPTVSLDLSGLSDDGYRRVEGLSLEKAVLVRLVQEGFAVVARKAAPDVVVTIADAAGEITLAVAATTGEQQQAVPMKDVPIPELQLELSQKIVEMVRAVPPPPAPEPRPSPPPPEPPRVDPPPIVTPPPPVAPPEEKPDEAQRTLSVAVFAGALVRPGGLDPAFRVDAAIDGGALSYGLGGGYVPSTGGSVAVGEFALNACAGIGGGGGAIRWRALALVGAHAHAYAVDPAPAVDPSGLRWDPLVGAAITLEWRPTDALLLALRAAPRYTFRDREHVVGGASAWSRGGAGLEASIGVGWAGP